MPCHNAIRPSIRRFDHLVSSCSRRAIPCAYTQRHTFPCVVFFEVNCVSSFYACHAKRLGVTGNSARLRRQLDHYSEVRQRIDFDFGSTIKPFMTRFATKYGEMEARRDRGATSEGRTARIGGSDDRLFIELYNRPIRMHQCGSLLSPLTTADPSPFQTSILIRSSLCPPSTRMWAHPILLVLIRLDGS